MLHSFDEKYLLQIKKYIVSSALITQYLIYSSFFLHRLSSVCEKFAGQKVYQQHSCDKGRQTGITIKRFAADQCCPTKSKCSNYKNSEMGGGVYTVSCKMFL